MFSRWKKYKQCENNILHFYYQNKYTNNQRKSVSCHSWYGQPHGATDITDIPSWL